MKKSFNRRRILENVRIKNMLSKRKNNNESKRLISISRRFLLFLYSISIRKRTEFEVFIIIIMTVEDKKYFSKGKERNRVCLKKQTINGYFSYENILSSSKASLGMVTRSSTLKDCKHFLSDYVAHFFSSSAHLPNAKRQSSSAIFFLLFSSSMSTDGEQRENDV